MRHIIQGPYILRPEDRIFYALETDKFSIDGRRRTVGRRQTVHLMDEFGRQTMIICPRWTEVDGGRRLSVHLMDGFRRRTIKNLKMWTEVDRWTKVRPWRPVAPEIDRKLENWT